MTTVGEIFDEDGTEKLLASRECFFMHHIR